MLVGKTFCCISPLKLHTYRKKCPKVSRNVHMCPEMSTSVQKCQKMCLRNIWMPLQSRCHEEVLYTRLNRSCSINSAASFPPANNTAASTSASSSVSTCLAAAASADAAAAASMEAAADAAAETPNNFTQQHKGSFYSESTFVISPNSDEPHYFLNLKF